MSFTLTIATNDLDVMLRNQNHVATMMGTVTREVLSAQRLSVTDGQFNRFIAGLNSQNVHDAALDVFPHILTDPEQTA